MARSLREMHDCCMLLLTVASLVSCVRVKSDHDVDRYDSESEFELAWTEYLRSLPPLEDFMSNSNGAVGSPRLEGPQDATHLAILLHGFTGCPGTWDWIVPDLVAQNFRVMRPVLPGHGRKWLLEATDVEVIHDDNQLDNVTAPVKDNLTDMPEDVAPYFEFVQVLGHMSHIFKAERHASMVIVVGHSLGGLLAMHLAITFPHVVDRVLLFNPYFGPSYNAVRALRPVSGQVISWDLLAGPGYCENKRMSNSGGYCQFKLRHALAVVDTSTQMFCSQWSLSRCYIDGRLGPTMGVYALLLGSLTFANPLALLAAAAFGYSAGQAVPFDIVSAKSTARAVHRLPSIQIVATDGDPAVDNSRIMSFMTSMQTIRNSKRNDTGLCWLPAETGHNYFNQRDDSSRRYWWEDALKQGVLNYMVNGKTLESVSRSGGVRCIDETEWW